MNKHIIAYTAFIVTIVTLLGISNSSEYESQVLDLQKAGKSLEKVNRDNKKLINDYQQKLAEKDKLIAKLRNDLAEQKKLANQEIKVVQKKATKEESQNSFISSMLKASLEKQNNEMAKKFRKKSLLKKYKTLFNKLNLSEEDQKHLIDLILERDNENQLQMANLLSEGNNVALDPQAFSKDNLATEKEISDFLGYDYDNFKKYEKTEQERRLVDQIDLGLSGDDQLTDDQKDKLVDLYAERNKAKRLGNGDDQDFAEKAEEFLNPHQVDEVNKSFKRNNSRFGIPMGRTTSVIEFEVK